MIAYMSFTTHFINDNFRRKDFLVGLKAFNDTHTGVHISAKLDQLIAILPLESKKKLTYGV